MLIGKLFSTQSYCNVRHMATLKDIRLRIKAVSNIQKLTKSMKMVAAARYNKAERDFAKIKPLGDNINSLIGNYLKPPSEINKKIIVGISSDRGLCGPVHTSLAKAIILQLKSNPQVETKLVLIGEKLSNIVCKSYQSNTILTASGVGRTKITFEEVAFLVDSMSEYINNNYVVEIFYNHFKSVISFNSRVLKVSSSFLLVENINSLPYEIMNDENLTDIGQFSLAAAIYYAMNQGSLSEFSARMTSMDNASKNAGEMITKLTLTFNRTRQAMITKELIEIISGAIALKQE